MIIIKVFIETTTLIAASINYKKLCHQNYSEAKSLFNFFEKNIETQTGFSSDTVINQAWAKLEKAINDTITEQECKFENDILRLDLFSKIKDSAEDRLTQNIRLLAKYALNNSATEKILNEEIAPFYKQFKEKVKNEGQFTKQGLRLKESTMRMIRRGNQPFFKGIPDIIDKTILSEAVYIKRTFIKEEKLCLASIDKDFSPSKKDSVLRDEIYKKFEIFCDHPSKIFSELRQNVPCEKKT